MALLAIGLVAGACGANTTTSNTKGSADAVLAALTKTAQTGSFRLIWIYTSGPEPIQEYDSLSGVVDLAGGRLNVTSLGMTGPAAKVGPGGTPPTPSPTDSAMTTMICIGKDLWLSNVLTPKSWIHQTIPTGKEMAGLPVADPGQIFSGLRAHLTDITAVGKQLIDGVETSHYQGVELVQEHSPGTTGPVHFKVNMWVDTTGLVLQLKIEATWNVPATPTGTGVVPGGANTETVTAHFFDFGVHVDIQPPPHNQVTEDRSNTSVVTSGHGLLLGHFSVQSPAAGRSASRARYW